MVPILSAAVALAAFVRFTLPELSLTRWTDFNGELKACLAPFTITYHQEQSPPTKQLTLLTLVNVVHVVQVRGTDGNMSEPQCVNDLQAIRTNYWTDWYSSNDSLTDVGEQEDFSKVCMPINETQCREKFTHRSLADTGLSYTVSCENGLLRCLSADTNLNQTCVDMEVRLKCSIPLDALPDPNLHWSLSELDSGNTRGAIESWYCSGLVDQVTPIKGDLIGHVDG
eukprot:XP_003726983.1 PREDICTED: uncharacterized protein LOC100892945 [Strongylocentrotus purpuratus]